MEGIRSEQRHLSEPEIVGLIEQITRMPIVAKRGFFKALIGTPDTIQAEVEFYPDMLNGRHRVVLDSISVAEGDEDYLEGVQMVAETLKRLKEAGVKSTFDVSSDFSDKESLKADVNTFLEPKEQAKNNIEAAA